MTKQRLSPWFPPHIKPIHVGAYQTNYAWRPRGYAWWDGKVWGWAGSTPRLAYVNRHPYGANQSKQWRGIVK